MLQTLLDVAIQEQNLENSNDSARIGQLVEILAIKDEANRDLHRGVQELETALAEARMNLEYLHSKWRDEAVAREEADTTVKLLRSQIDASQVLPTPHHLCLGDLCLLQTQPNLTAIMINDLGKPCALGRLPQHPSTRAVADARKVGRPGAVSRSIPQHPCALGASC